MLGGIPVENLVRTLELPIFWGGILLDSLLMAVEVNGMVSNHANSFYSKNFSFHKYIGFC
jgi:hypothetical protein